MSTAAPLGQMPETTGPPPSPKPTPLTESPSRPLEGEHPRPAPPSPVRNTERIRRHRSDFLVHSAERGHLWREAIRAYLAGERGVPAKEAIRGVADELSVEL